MRFYVFGLENNKVKLIEYTEEWNELYSLEKNRLLKKFGDIIVNIQHIGSTSIPGMTAKPIIDILVSVGNKELLYSTLKYLYDLDYRFLGNGGKRGRLFFVKGNENITYYHLHLLVAGSYYEGNYFLFRDYLRENEECANKYKHLKVTLSEKFPSNRDKYSQFKSKFVKRVLRKNIDLKECITDNYYRIYSTKSLFLQRYMNDFILRRGIGFASEVLYRAIDLYSNSNEEKLLSLNDIIEHLNSKFTDQELEIMYEEKENCFKENIEIWDVVRDIEN